MRKTKTFVLLKQLQSEQYWLTLSPPQQSPPSYSQSLLLLTSSHRPSLFQCSKGQTTKGIKSHKPIESWFLIAEKATKDTNNFADIKNDIVESQGENLSKSVTNKPINLEVTAPLKSNKLHMCFFHIFCAVYHLSMSN